MSVSRSHDITKTTETTSIFDDGGEMTH